jgi:hypothetical protein
MVGRHSSKPQQKDYTLYKLLLTSRKMFCNMFFVNYSVIDTSATGVGAGADCGVVGSCIGVVLTSVVMFDNSTGALGAGLGATDVVVFSVFVLVSPLITGSSGSTGSAVVSPLDIVGVVTSSVVDEIVTGTDVSTIGDIEVDPTVDVATDTDVDVAVTGIEVEVA